MKKRLDLKKKKIQISFSHTKEALQETKEGTTNHLTPRQVKISIPSQLGIAQCYLGTIQQLASLCMVHGKKTRKGGEIKKKKNVSHCLWPKHPMLLLV